MSLQEIAFCYICMMLALPFTICLLMTLKGSKVKEVKQYEALLLKEAILVKDTTTLTSMNWESYYSRLAILETIASLEGANVEIDWEEYQEEEDDLEPVNNSCYECGGRSYLGVTCEKCYKESDSRACGVSTTPASQDEEESLNQITLELIEKEAHFEELEEERQAMWYQDLEDALMASKALVPKFKKRKTNFKKKDLRAANGVERRVGRRVKASWLR